MAGYLKRKETRWHQRIAKPKLHPRGLARSIARAMGAGKDWREQVVSKLQPMGQKYLHPELHK